MGRLVVSVDAELAWGVHDSYPLSDAEQRRVAVARSAWNSLLETFEQFDVPATWAVVGHLLVAGADELRDRHPLAPEWFERAREGLDSHPTRWQGTDLVASVRTSPVDHEIGSHSFSHVVFDEVSASVARAECRLAREVGREYGLDLRSFVYPRNAVAHREVLAETGFDCYRGCRPQRLPEVPGLRGLAALAGGVSGLGAPPLVTPRQTDAGPVEIPASLFLGGFRGQPWRGMERAGADPVVRFVREGIDRACDRDGLLHLWLHPNDLTDARYVARVNRVLAYAADRRDDGDLRILTMGAVADAVADGESDG